LGSGLIKITKRKVKAKAKADGEIRNPAFGIWAASFEHKNEHAHSCWKADETSVKEKEEKGSEKWPSTALR
jgi:hypothetical protein